MKITVIVCTYNRCDVLSKAMESVAASTLPLGVDWEVLVVDNNSDDRTPQVVKEFSDRFPGRFRYLFEGKPGKSYALNSGVREARGSVLAFMDDDVIAESTWLQNLTGTLQNGEWAGTGGRTLPTKEFNYPRWFALEGPRGLGGVLCAFFDLGDKPCQLSQAPYGANMAFRKDMFEQYGGFRTDMGPSPDGEIPRPNEDTEFGRRLMAAGERVRYEPAAIVYHPVVEERLKKEYFLSWWFDYGRAQVREVGRRPNVWGIPRYYLTIAKITTSVLTVRILSWIFTLNPADRFFRKCWVWKAFGNVAEIWSESRKTSDGNKTVTETNKG